MRRIIALVLCLFILTTTVSASNGVTTAVSTGSVTSSGTCQITLTATVRLDSPDGSLVFPLGTDISGVSLNGGSAGLTKENGITCVKLNHLRNQTGAFPITIQYTVNSIVTTDENTGIQTITVPLLYGFEYPVEQLSFSVSLPGEFDEAPVFLSGYHEQDIERSITYSISGVTITGTVDIPLKDRETLFMTLQAPDGMFPRSQAAGGSLVFDVWAMGICAFLALVYWFATMAHLPSWPTYRSTPPDGVCAGMVGSYLTRRPADLTMMVIHWAQLGYLIIQLDDNGRVILHKKMNMGNERSNFEQRCFRNLFGKKQMADATGYRYARLYESTAIASRRFSAGFRKDSGNPLLLRILSAGVGVFAGIAMGDLVSTSPAWRIIWMILLSTLTTAASWQLQKGMFCLRQPDRQDLIYGIILSAAVLGAGIVITNALPYAAIGIIWSALAGIMGAWGGKRSENGTRICSDLNGLRRYMKKVTRTELLRILRSNPDYYYELIPFAYAMGVDRRFSNQFESLRIPACNWLVTGMAPPRTPAEWIPLLREAVEAMDELSRRPFWEKYSRN